MTETATPQPATTQPATTRMPSTAAAARGATPPWTQYLPWTDRRGRLARIKLAAFALALAPGLVLAAQWAAGTLGARPLNAVIHGTGLWAIRFLLISLAVTPARFVFDAPKVFTVRRMLGLTALAYALIHLGLYVGYQGFDLLKVGSEIVRRVYLTIGFVALLGLVALGVTSTDAMMRRLGKRWKRLHRLVYGIAVLGLLHHFMQAKADVTPAVLVAGFYVWLMLYRVLPVRQRINPAALIGLAAAASAGAMAIEFAWYRLATRINPWRVLDANFAFAYGIRPAVWVGIVALGIAAIVAVRRAVTLLALRRAASPAA